MIAVVCVDERNGMLFHNRRLSLDRVQMADMLTLCGEKRLWICAFSQKLLEPFSNTVIVDEEFLALAGTGEYCFVEDRPLLPWLERLEGLVIYRWNRAYPSDVKLDLDPEKFMLLERTEFAGSSHPRITREIYVKY